MTWAEEEALDRLYRAQAACNEDDSAEEILQQVNLFVDQAINILEQG